MPSVDATDNGSPSPNEPAPAAAGDASAITIKPGRLTSEFIFKLLVTGANVVVAGGVVTNNTIIQIALIVGMTLSAMGYGIMRTSLKKAAINALPMLVVLLAASSACTSSQRNDTLRASLTALNAARDGYKAWDTQARHSLIANAATRDGAEKQLADHYEKVEPVEQGLQLGYQMLATALTLTDQPSLDTATAAVLDVIKQIKQITGGK